MLFLFWGLSILPVNTVERPLDAQGQPALS